MVPVSLFSKFSSVECVDVVHSRANEETEPVLQTCYSLLYCAVD